MLRALYKQTNSLCENRQKCTETLNNAKYFAIKKYENAGKRGKGGRVVGGWISIDNDGNSLKVCMQNAVIDTQ